MKILHLNCSDIGSTGKIIFDISLEAEQRGWETVFLFPRRTRESFGNVKPYVISSRLKQAIYRRIHYFTGFQYGFTPFATGKALKIIKKEKPDVVHLHSINCCTVNVYRVLSFLKKYNIPTVVTNHAEFFYTGNCPHAHDCEKWLTGCGKCPRRAYSCSSKFFDTTHAAWKKMKKAFSGLENAEIVSVSPWVYSRSIKSPILEGLSQTVVKNGINLDVFNLKETCEIRNRYIKTERTKIILQVTSNFSDNLVDEKGGKYLMELAKSMLDKDVVFIVVGQNNAKEKLPSNIITVGAIRDQNKLAEYYNMADLCVVTSKRETFGMTVAESLCCGTPVVGFKSGGSESIAINEHTEFFDFGDVESLKVAIENKWLDYKTQTNKIEISNAAKQEYDSKIMANKYCDIYKGLLSEK